MSAQVFNTFDSFWAALMKRLRTNNHPTYHPCCRAWAWRARKGSKTTHTEQIKWGTVLNSLGDVDLSTKDILRTHMAENGWGVPIYVTPKCMCDERVHTVNSPSDVFKNIRNQEFRSGAFMIHRPLRTLSYPVSIPNPSSAQSGDTRQFTDRPSQPEQHDEIVSVVTPTSVTST